MVSSPRRRPGFDHGRGIRCGDPDNADPRGGDGVGVEAEVLESLDGGVHGDSAPDDAEPRTWGRRPHPVEIVGGQEGLHGCPPGPGELGLDTQALARSAHGLLRVHPGAPSPRDLGVIELDGLEVVGDGPHSVRDVAQDLHTDPTSGESGELDGGQRVEDDLRAVAWREERHVERGKGRVTGVRQGRRLR